MVEHAGIIGLGEMGLPMSQHMVGRGLEVVGFDTVAERVDLAAAHGVRPAAGVGDVAARADTIVAVLRTDEQAEQVAEGVAAAARPDQVLVIAGTHSLALMARVADIVAPAGVRVIDAPVVFGTSGAREGTLLSLCGGSETDVARATPVLMGYSRAVEHVGPLGAGQLAKACNNLMHWVHCVANFECLALAKRYGVDAQRMREVLLQSPAENGTLRRWDGTRFTWQEKDMDLVTDLAQSAGLVLPLTGQVDQLVKTLSAADVAALLYGEECSYLGQPVVPMNRGSHLGTAAQ